MKGSDTSILMDYLADRSQLLLLGRPLWNIFWAADGRGIASSRHFHEVLVVDSTTIIKKKSIWKVLISKTNHIRIERDYWPVIGKSQKRTIYPVSNY